MVTTLQITRFSNLLSGKLVWVCLIVFVWASQPVASQQPQATISEGGTTLKLGNRVLLTSEKDGFMSVHKVRHSPDRKFFVVIGCGYECNDNIGFLFNADGSGKRKFTARWDNILQDKVEWSADGKRLFYYRVNSTGADPPANALVSGWVEIDLTNWRKAMASSRALKPDASYAVFNVRRDDFLNIRESANAKGKSVGKLAHDAKDIRFAGEKGKGGWVKITRNGVSGWVNQNFLYEIQKDQ
ncbi:MAG: hypothetical protein ACKVZH_05115 [Blastocatellia bacterium]